MVIIQGQETQEKSSVLDRRCIRVGGRQVSYWYGVRWNRCAVVVLMSCGVAIGAGWDQLEPAMSITRQPQPLLIEATAATVANTWAQTPDTHTQDQRLVPALLNSLTQVQPLYMLERSKQLHKMAQFSKICYLHLSFFFSPLSYKTLGVGFPGAF